MGIFHLTTFKTLRGITTSITIQLPAVNKLMPVAGSQPRPRERETFGIFFKLGARLKHGWLSHLLDDIQVLHSFFDNIRVREMLEFTES